MKQVTLSANQLLEFGADIAVHKIEAVDNLDAVYTWDIAEWNGQLTAFRKSSGLLPIEGTEFKPLGSFIGQAIKLRKVSEKCLYFTLRVYDGSAEGKVMWVDCTATGSTIDYIEKYCAQKNVWVQGSFSLETHETFGRKIKLFLNNAQVIFNTKDSKAVEAAPAPTKAKTTKVDTDEIPF